MSRNVNTTKALRRIWHGRVFVSVLKVSFMSLPAWKWEGVKLLLLEGSSDGFTVTLAG